MEPKNSEPSKKIRGQLFGIPTPIEKAQLILIPAPWAVSLDHPPTVLGPETILRTSYKIGCYQPLYPQAKKLKMAMLPIPHGWKLKSHQLSNSVKTYLQARQAGSKIINKPLTTRVDQYTLAFKERIKNKALMYMTQQNKMVGLLGGEQICALGLIQACAEQYKNFGILHIDAHPDLQKNYQGFHYTHRSLIYHTLQIPQNKSIVQLGLRDYTEEEANAIQKNPQKITTFPYETLQQALYKGTTWHQICEEIIAKLPNKIYLSFDIDALDPKLCPTTAQPVPGGLNVNQILYLLQHIVKAGKTIIAFDLSEVAFNGETEWDALVASHLLHRIGILMAISQKKL